MKDKATIIKSAHKYASKGHIDKAIAEWHKLLDEGNDGNIHNTVGDLYLRKGSEKQATESYSRAAEIFRKDGFYPKAIALFKKVLNIAPNHIESLVALAKLNAERGLTGNAIDNYYRAAEIYNRDGHSEKATAIVETMLQMAPSDLSTRAKIAYLYFRIGLIERAANEYASIASTYRKQDNPEKAEEYYHKALEHDPENIPALIGLSKMAENAAEIEKAFSHLQKALSLAPDHKETLFHYSRLSISVNKTAEAKKILHKLIEANPSYPEPKKLLGTLYIDERNLKKAWDELLPYIDYALDGENWSEAHELLNKFREMYPLPVKQRLVRICRARGDEDTLSGELKEFADICEKEELYNEALQAYKEAFELRADDRVSSEKIKELEIKLGIAPPPIEKVSEQETLIEDIFALPESGEAGIPEMETPLETGVEMKGFAITPFGLEEEEPPLQTQETMSAEEFAARKAEADFYSEQGLQDEAIKIYESLIAALPGDQEVSKKLDSLKASTSEAGESFMEHFQGEGSAEESDVDDDLQALFSQFEKNEEEAVDYESCYISGLEFKQKGLWDEAVKELRKAAKDPENRQRNTTMLALCYIEKGAYPLAIAEFTKLMDSMSPSDSTYLHVKYELANAHLNNKDYSRAIELFSEVHAEEPGFKDVSGKLDFLKSQQATAQGETPKPKKDRVSYI